MQISKHLTYANVASTLALVIAVGGGGAAVAATVAKNSVGSPQIKAASVKKSDLGANAVTSAKVKDGSLVGADIDESTLAQVPSAAQAGHAATAGSATTAGSAATAGKATTADSATTTANVLRAFVEADGTIVSSLSSPGVTASKDVTGQYGVVFTRAVTACTAVASLGITDPLQPAAGQIGTAPLEGESKGVFVKTRNKDADAEDRSFALVVVC